MELKYKESESKTSKPQKTKWRLWLLLLVVVAVVVVVLCIKNCSPDGNKIETKPATGIIDVEQSATQNTDAKGITDETPVLETATDVTANQTTPAVSKPSTENASSVQPAAKSTGNNISSISQGSLEEKAMQVIRGNFGNGAERKQNLGNEYNTIQQKVNEMYPNGEIKFWAN